SAALFVRGKQGVALTDFGRDFEPYAKSMLAELRHLADGLNAWHTGAAGQVVIGTLLTASTTLLPEAITRLIDAAPGVTVDVRVGTNASLFPALVRGDLDIVVGFVPVDRGPPLPHGQGARLAHEKLYDESLCAVVGQGNPIRRRRKLALQDLEEFDWILPTPDSVAYGTACAVFRKAGLDLPRHIVHSVSILTNIGLLRRRPMIALMPHSAVEPFASAGVVSILPLGSLGVFGTVGYTVRADRSQSAVLKHLVSALHESIPSANRLAAVRAGGG
ncbi:MAG: LysR family transcriptional regulator, partial [Burkholderiales bacterium]|nr:LysR family transcriptional regulator [Burkholderiales bacterium]